MADLIKPARWWRSLLARAQGRGEFTVDMFAGGGGTSRGIEGALGCAVDIAINHDEHAIAIHKANHPSTYHFLTDVREVNPRKVLPDREVGLLWLSPDCTHHSRAKGGKPVKRNRRALANVGIVWAECRKPRVIILENVQEFEDWGPLGEDLLPDRSKRGQSFRRWCAKLRRLGYQVEYKSLVAADFGAPTIRKRLFLIARRDGRPIVWPKVTHCPADRALLLGLKPWRGAYECIDWQVPTRSIFERKRPLAEATLRRIHAGVFKFVFNGDPFIVTPGHSGEGFRGQSVDEPLSTVTASRDFGALVAPVFSGVGGRAGQSPPRSVVDPLRTATGKADEGLVTASLVSIDNNSSEAGSFDVTEPLRTTTTENRHALVAASLVQAGYGERDGQEPRTADIKKPLNTVVGGGGKSALVEAFLLGAGGPARAGKPTSLDKPLGTQLARNHKALGAAYLVKQNYGSDARDLKEPLATAMAGGKHHALATAFLNKHFTGAIGSDLEDPLGTITASDHNSLTTAHLTHQRKSSNARDIKDPLSAQATKPHDALTTAHLTTFRGTSKGGRDVREPMPSLTGQGLHVGEVRGFLVKYFRTGVPASLRKPAPTLSTKHRLGLVEVQGELYQIEDIRLRMLTPRELLRAQFGKYAEGYILLGNQAQQVKAIGNSVAPEVAEALVKANYIPNQAAVEVAA